MWDYLRTFIIALSLLASSQIAHACSTVSANITDCGNVGISTASPGDTLEVFGNSATEIGVAIVNAGTSAGTQARHQLMTGTPNSYVTETLVDNAGNPYLVFNAGSAVQSFSYLAPAFAFKKTDGTSIFATIDLRGVTLGAGSFNGSGAGLTSVPASALPGSVTPEAVFNVADYGGCGTAKDAANLNATFAAARAASAYTSGHPVRVVGGMAAAAPGSTASPAACNVTSPGVNATGFESFGGGAKLIISDLALDCSGSGVICLDTLGDLNLRLDHVSIHAVGSTPPMIGLQRGWRVGTTPTQGSCCIQQDHDLDIEGSYTFAAELNAGAESTSEYYPIIRNEGVATQGSIFGNFSTSGGGYSGATGVMNNVQLTGGSGSGAQAQVTIGSGGAVSSIIVTTQGKQYKPGDVLTVGTTASGTTPAIGTFATAPTVTVNSVQQFGLVMDGMNHWGLSSTFVSVNWPQDHYYTFTENNIFGGSMRMYGVNGAPLWMNGTVGFTLNRVYLASGGKACIDMFDNNTPELINNIGSANGFAYFDMECEVGSGGSGSDILLTGVNATPNLPGLHYRTPQETSASVFALDAGVTSPVLPRADISVGQQYGSTPIPLAPGSLASWAITGKVEGVPASGTSTTNTALCGSPSGAAGCVQTLVNGVVHWTPYF